MSELTTNQIAEKLINIDTSHLPSVEEVFKSVCDEYPDLQLLLASSALEDVNEVSDVDINLLYNPILASALFKTIIGEKNKPTCTIYTLGGYPRVVNIYPTTSVALYRRSAIHRENELYINTNWPEIYESARKQKCCGASAEQAYAYAIGADGLDPDDVLLYRDVIDDCVKKMQQK